MGEGSKLLEGYKSYTFIFSDYIKYSLTGTQVDCEIQETIWTSRLLGAEKWKPTAWMASQEGREAGDHFSSDNPTLREQKHAWCV